jgi:hypothetical protein
VSDLRSAAELKDVADPAWPDLRELLGRTDGHQSAEILPVTPEAGEEALHRIQVSAGSYLGALALHTGGVLVAGGWVRVLGGGFPERGLPSLAEANPALGRRGGPAPPLLVGYDVLGGRFEVNGSDPAAGGRPGEPGQVCYFEPESLEWKLLKTPDRVFGHSMWLRFLMLGNLTDFYWTLQWPGWEDDIAGLRHDEGMSFYPPLPTLKGAEEIAAADRRAVPVGELFSLYEDLRNA